MEPTHFESLYPDGTRFEEIEKILSFIKEGSSCQVIGVPGSGRSNILGLLSYNRNIRIKHLGENQKWFHFVLLNFSEIKNKPILDITKFIFLGILDSLRERGMNDEYENINKIFKESVGYKDELVLFQGLKKTIDFLAIEKELTIVLLLDRFEDYIPSLTSDFFANLRVLRNRAKYRFSVIFPLSRPLEDIFEPAFFSDFYEFVAGNLVYLSLHDKQGLNFRISYLEKVIGKTLDKKIIEKVIELTGGHGNLARRCFEAILASDINPSLSISELVDFSVKQKPVRSGLFAIWDSLNPSEQDLLTSNIDILTSDGENQTIVFLKNLGLIKNNRLAIPILKDYVKDSARIKSEEKGKIVFDQRANEIKKGEVSLSNKLTSSEFRLLKFLIQNPEKILERDGIIQAVWKETQSTAGVTDQALDQLIFRLRKKIEANPNSPTHIQTIKGRGFKFAP